MNIAVSFLDGYVDSGARVADIDRILWDADYLDGYRQRIVDEREWEAETWMPDTNEAPAHSDLIFDADRRGRMDAFVLETDNPTVWDLQMMYEADSADEEPGYRTSWHTF